MCVVQEEALECAKVLLTSGARLEHIVGDGKTALALACAHGLLHMVRLLIDAGALLNVALKVHRKYS